MRVRQVSTRWCEEEEDGAGCVSSLHLCSQTNELKLTPTNETDVLAEPLAMFLKTLEDLGSYASHQGSSSSKSNEPPLSLSAMTNNDLPPIAADKILKVYTGAEAM